MRESQLKPLKFGVKNKAKTYAHARAHTHTHTHTPQFAGKKSSWLALVPNWKWMTVWFKSSQNLSCTSRTGHCLTNQATKSRMSSSTPLSCTVVPLLGKTVWQFLRRLSRVAIWSAMAPLGVYTQKIWKQRLKHDVRDPCSMIHGSQKVETTQMSTYSWME